MLTYLALGDSYTIGEQVLSEDNFPNQTVTLLQKQYGIAIKNPDIVAITGWTTDELIQGIKNATLQEHYDFVTLLIGVNNQYRGRDLDNYKSEFTTLLLQAIAFANGNMQKVFVLSIPDWGVTPFAEGKDRDAIAKQIDEFNIINKAITYAHHCNYLDITDSNRKNLCNEAYLTPDKLHCAGREYKNWAVQLAALIAEQLLAPQ